MLIVEPMAAAVVVVAVVGLLTAIQVGPGARGQIA